MTRNPSLILDSFAHWEPSLSRVCDCGSFNVETARTAPNGIMATAFRCEECDARWNEE